MTIPIPGLKQAVGAGDVIAAAAEAVGVKPCGGCLERKAWLNAHLPKLVPVGGVPAMRTAERLQPPGFIDASTVSDIHAAVVEGGETLAHIHLREGVTRVYALTASGSKVQYVWREGRLMERADA